MNKTYDAKDNGEEANEGMDDLVKSLQETINAIGMEELSTIPEVSNENGSSSIINSLADDDEFSRDHVQKLQNYHDQLQELDDIIRSKQDLAAKMASGEGNWREMKDKYEKDMKDMESEITNLSREKDEMQKALQNAKSTSVASK